MAIQNLVNGFAYMSQKLEIMIPTILACWPQMSSRNEIVWKTTPARLYKVLLCDVIQWILIMLGCCFLLCSLWISEFWQGEERIDQCKSNTCLSYFRKRSITLQLNKFVSRSESRCAILRTYQQTTGMMVIYAILWTVNGPRKACQLRNNGMVINRKTVFDYYKFLISGSVSLKK